MKDHFPYDVIAVLGYSFNEKMEMPEHIEKRLKIVSYLYHWGFARTIALSGKWSGYFDRKKITPIMTEAKAMGKVLLEHAIPPQALIYEEKSQDTIGNAYHLREDIFTPHHFKNALIICADYHIPRVEYIFVKVFGSGFNLDYYATQSDILHKKSMLEQEARKLEHAKEFFSRIEEGDIDFLKKNLSLPGLHAKEDAVMLPD